MPCTSGKIEYTKRKAKATAKANRGHLSRKGLLLPSYCYQCDECGQWHLTESPDYMEFVKAVQTGKATPVKALSSRMHLFDYTDSSGRTHRFIYSKKSKSIFFLEEIENVPSH